MEMIVTTFFYLPLDILSCEFKNNSNVRSQSYNVHPCKTSDVMKIRWVVQILGGKEQRAMKRIGKIHIVSRVYRIVRHCYRCRTDEKQFFFYTQIWSPEKTDDCILGICGAGRHIMRLCH